MPRHPLVFGESLDREAGIQSVRSSSMEDQRNVLLYDGRATIRKGIAETLTIAGITHYLAIEAIRMDRTGIIVAYNSGTGVVSVHGVDADGTTATLIGTWFTKTSSLATPPIVSTTEIRGQVFMAHAEASVNSRETTFVYDKLQGPALFALTADLDDDGTKEDVKFRGVERYKEFLVGWGYGDETDQERPEMVRVSLPGQPTELRSEGYLIAGDPLDPVVTCKPAGESLLVFKTTETHHIFGSSRATFGILPIDDHFGCVGDRLAVAVNGLCFFWSAQGPRVSDGRGPSGDLSLDLDYLGFDPSTLVAHGSEVNAFSGYIPVQRVVHWVFGRRVYALTIRSGLRKARWGYWEFPFDANCFGVLFTGTGLVFTAPTGFPTCNALDGSAGTSLAYTWNNNSPAGNEFNEVWEQSFANLVKSWLMDSDGGGGVATDFTKVTDAAHTLASTIDTSAQKLALSASTGAAVSYTHQDVTVVTGTTYMFLLEAKIANAVATAKANITIEWRTAVGTISTETAVDVTGASFGIYKIEATAPGAAVIARIRCQVESLASGDTIDAWFKRALHFDSSAAWSKDQIVNVTLAATQSTTIHATTPGATYRVRSRFGRGFQYTAGYTSGDPDNWPDTSECYVLASPGSLAHLFAAYFLSNTPSHSSHLIFALSDSDWAAVLAGGATAGFRVERNSGAGFSTIATMKADNSNAPFSGGRWTTNWRDVLHFGYDEGYAGETLKQVLAPPAGVGFATQIAGLTWFAYDDLVHGFNEVDVVYKVTPFIGGLDLGSISRTRYMGPEHEPEAAALGRGPVTAGGGAGAQPTNGGPTSFSLVPGTGQVTVNFSHSDWFWAWVQDCYCDLNGICEKDIEDHYRAAKVIVAQFLVQWRQPSGTGGYTDDSSGWQDCVGGGPGPSKFVVTSKTVTGLLAGDAGVRVKYRVTYAGTNVEGAPSDEKTTTIL